MKKNNYFLGLLGSILGTVISLFPLMFMELRYGSINLIAGTLVGLASFFIYKLVGGKVKNFSAVFINFLGINIGLIIYDFIMSGMLIYDSGLYPSFKNIFTHYSNTYSKIMLLINTSYRSFMPMVVVIILTIIFIKPELIEKKIGVA